MYATDTLTAASSQQETLAHRRTLWRWHFYAGFFYAGLFVMPLLIVLTITGTLYCFQPQIEPLLYRDRMIVADTGAPRLPTDALLAKAVAHELRDTVPTLAQIETDRTRSAEFVFRLKSGKSESVYVNPYDGAVLGTLSVEHRLMKQIRNLHRGLMLGKPGALIMELAGCWTLVMIGTGIALWWPGKPRAGGTWWPRLLLRGRAWWRDLHAVGDVWLALGALFFVLSGLPWSWSWGKEFKALATSASLDYPKGAWGEAHVHSAMPSASASSDMHAMHGMHMKMDDLPLHQTPWAVGATTVPDSAQASSSAPRVSLDAVIALAANLGVKDNYGIALPNTSTGVYTVSYFPPDPRDERTLHIDQYSGKALSDIGYQNYGRVAQWISYGTSLHMGRYFGFANQIVSSATSLGLAALAVSGFGHVDQAPARAQARRAGAIGEASADARMARQSRAARRDFSADGTDDARGVGLRPPGVRQGERVARGRFAYFYLDPNRNRVSCSASFASSRAASRIAISSVIGPGAGEKHPLKYSDRRGSAAESTAPDSKVAGTPASRACLQAMKGALPGSVCTSERPSPVISQFAPSSASSSPISRATTSAPVSKRAPSICSAKPSPPAAPAPGSLRLATPIAGSSRSAKWARAVSISAICSGVTPFCGPKIAVAP